MIEALYQIYQQYPQLCTDSRSACPNQLFFGLRGERFNGNCFAQEALERGCVYAVIDDPVYYRSDPRYLLVADALDTLQQLANWHRHRLEVPVIAITGSNGKTTTKELLAAMLSQRYRCYATAGNLNNHIGVALSLLAAPISTEVVVLEMGANQVGEIAQLCKIAEPTHGLITTIGYAHIAGFGSIEGVMRGKGELYAYISQAGGTLFVNSADPTIMALAEGLQANRVRYPQQGDFYTIDFVGSDPYLLYRNKRGETITTHLLGGHHFSNVAAAGCIASYMGVDDAMIDQAVQAYIPTNNRSQVIHKGSSLVVLDAYNANPTSVKAALEAFHNIARPYKVVILGSMNELGAQTIAFHQQIVSLTFQHGYQEVLLCGHAMEEASLCNPKAIYYKDKTELIIHLQNRTFQDSAILIKGSHSYAMQSIVPHLVLA